MPKKLPPELEPIDFGSLNERMISYCTGQLAISIGRGNFRDEICRILGAVMQASCDYGRKSALLTRVPKKKKRK